MIWKNSKEACGAVSKNLHWLMAALVLGMICLGFYMVTLERGPDRLAFFTLHKAFGMLVLFLVIPRLLWRFSFGMPEALASYKPYERFGAKIVHALLYVAMIGMPLSGWLMSSAAGYPFTFFGLFELPMLIAKNRELSGVFREIHEIGAFSLLGLVALHFAAALKHHLVDRDITMIRMLPQAYPRFAFAVTTSIGAVLILAASWFMIGGVLPKERRDQSAPEIESVARITAENALIKAPPSVARWQIDSRKSSIGFSVPVYGAAFAGTFRTFSGEVYFDPDNLAESIADITVVIASVDTGDDERDGYIKAEPWLDAAKFPQAHFVTRSFEKTGDNAYLAEGILTLRGVSLPVRLPFTLDFSEGENGKKTARMKGGFSFDRLAFGIGAGEWSDPAVVGNRITIAVSALAEAASPEAASPGPSR